MSPCFKLASKEYHQMKMAEYCCKDDLLCGLTKDLQTRCKRGQNMTNTFSEFPLYLDNPVMCALSSAFHLSHSDMQPDRGIIT